jgi:hypothetical protein
MRSIMIALGGTVLFARLACGSGEACTQATVASENPQMVDAATSGIEGRVTIRPVRPVERRGVTNQQPFRARITVLDPAGREVGVVESDADGRFRLALPPGSYVLRPESPGAYPRASEQRVVVRRNDVTRVEVVYDSGMR